VKPRVTLLLAVVLILILAAFLRFRGLGHDSLWSDEMVSVALARLDVPNLIHTNVAWQTNPPLFELILHGWMKTFGDSERTVRALPAIFGVAGVLMTYVLVRRLIGWRAAVAAMLLVAVSPVLVAYSQECRAYTLSILLGLLSTDLFVRLLLRTRDNEEGTGRLHAAYVVVTALMLYAHLFGVFTLLVQQLVYLAQLRRRRERLGLRPRTWVVDNIAIACLFAPFLPTVFYWWRTVAKVFPVKAVTLDDIARSYFIYSGSTATFILLIALAAFGIAHLRRARRRRGFAVLMGLALAPVVVPVLLAMVTRPVYMPRYGMMASVGLCGLAGVGAVALPRVLGIPMLAAVVVLSPFTDAAKIPRAQWREAGQFLQKNMRAGDLAVVSASASRRLFNYYVPNHELGLRGVDTPTLPVSLPLDGRRVWLVIHDSWYPANSFIARGGLRIERRLIARDVLVLELTDEPEPAAPPTITPASPSPSAATLPTTSSHSE
jgi:mannosyltransferase